MVHAIVIGGEWIEIVARSVGDFGEKNEDDDASDLRLRTLLKVDF